MTLDELLEHLEASGASVTATADRLDLHGPTSITRDPEVISTCKWWKQILVAAQRVARTGHILALCDKCGAPVFTAALAPRSRRRETWPRCKITPGCDGRHRPRLTDLERFLATSPPAPPPQPSPPPKADRRIFYGSRPPWPDEWPTRSVTSDIEGDAKQ